ncbi:predicted protein [Naegleria gruberi]|uniref:Predicted protein n=1 Tax=Naegleria gruberi TaxID=5762 RepID=D2VWS2_NAEGR|nr:uncharacterized protein NAEGRDRAFT_59430 [Naegleria gruberi]EFC38673.1 predicted protein [Naegleria gruberi]|eukprot:XP_002671417.1 predicted protein [Naegleria gruberi strain NEG-M]
MSSSRPTRERRLPIHLEDYIVGELDLRKNYEKEEKKKQKLLLKKKAEISKKEQAEKRKKEAIEATKKKKEAVKKSIRKKPSSSYYTSSSTTISKRSSSAITPYTDYTNPKFKVFTSTSEARNKLIEKTPGNKILKGSDDASKWSMSKLDTSIRYKSLNISDILSGCYYVPGNNHKLDTTGSDRVPAVQICFSFDTTGSMSSYLNNLKFKLQTICQQLMNDVRGLEIAIIAHGDYEDSKDNGSYCLYKLDFTTDIEQIISFVQSINSTSGYDGDECYEAVLLEAQSLSWVNVENTFTNRSLVVIGDADPHKSTEWFNIDWKQETSNLFDNHHVKIHSVRCGSSSWSTKDFYKTISEETGGSEYLLDTFEKTIEMFCGLIYREAADNIMMNDTTMQAHIDGAVSGEVTIVKPTMSSSDKMIDDGEKSDDITSLGSYIVTDDDILKIHTAIHSTCTEVKINGIEFAIQMNESSCRFVRVDGVVYIEQNKEKKTKYAKMALEGKKLTWICHAGNWGLIIDDKIEKR